ncbi:hypothetical protein L0Y40_01290 [Candidatus Wolfebacteria bacterium]|nr:hypothetical protein [Candidatus Wolfebacteria bacterium]
MHRYPGMRPKDEALWDEFVNNNRDAFDDCYYDVHIGEPEADPRKKSAMLATGMYEVSQWCVDVVARSGDAIYVIEIKPDAGPGALGQALAYKKLLVLEGKVPKNAIPLVLTDSISPILQKAADELGVLVWVA